MDTNPDQSPRRSIRAALPSEPATRGRRQCCTHEPASAQDHAREDTGRHNIGAGAGAAAGGIAGAIIGSAGGPVGTLVGVGISALAGGLAGRGVSEAISAEEEDQYWRQAYRARGYIPSGESYDRYQPAYRFGWESAAKHAPHGRTFDALEPDLQREWDSHRGGAPLDWMQARPAARDAWERAEGRIKRREHNAGRFIE
jgi:uncharacterized protein YcfJ